MIPFESDEFKQQVGARVRHRQGAGTDRRRYQDLGVARDPRISGGEISRTPGCGRRISRRARMPAWWPTKCMPAFRRLRNHLPMNFARRVIKRELPPPVVAEREAHRGAVDRLPRALRRKRTLSVRRFLCGRRDVCAGGVALSHLRRRCRTADARLYGGDHGAAGLAAMGRMRASRNLGSFAEDEVDWPKSPRIRHQINETEQQNKPCLSLSSSATRTIPPGRCGRGSP